VPADGDEQPLATDWLRASRAERQLLYRHARRAWERRRWDCARFLEAALGEPLGMGTGYVDNFRAGRIARGKAHAVARWLERHEPREAARLAAALHKARRSADGVEAIGWPQLFRRYGRFAGVEIVVLPDNPMGLVEVARPEPLRDRPLRLGERFCFRLDVAVAGHVLGFQHHAGVWYPLPLAETGLLCAVAAGVRTVPRRADDGAPLPLAEETHIGRFGFGFLVADAAQLEPLAAQLAPGQALSLPMAVEVAHVLDGLAPARRRIYRIDVRILP